MLFGLVLMLKAPNSSHPLQQRKRCDQGAAAPGPVEQIPPDVFIIDDEEGVCEFISLAIESFGLEAKSFLSAERALAALEHSQPDIVFLDIALGGSDAVDVIRALGERRFGGIVQLMSGSKSVLLDDVHRIGAMHGLNMCPPLVKPFRKEAIRRAVTSVPLCDRPEVAVLFAPPLEPGLDVALERGWLELWYQPKIDLRTKALVGAEGVVRYRHPVHGVHAIDGLLSRASTETRFRLTQHFLVTALRDWEELERSGVHLRTALNASFDALANLDIAALARQNRPASANWPGLILEISEHEVIKDIGLAHEIATQLRIYDITLAINNFGAGFSSLERLCELPFSELKLHAGFVAGCAEDAKNAGICRAGVDLAHRFGIISVASGLEAVSDLQAIRRMGCDVGQGPLLADPMPRSQFVARLSERARMGEAWFA